MPVALNIAVFFRISASESFLPAFGHRQFDNLGVYKRLNTFEIIFKTSQHPRWHFLTNGQDTDFHTDRSIIGYLIITIKQHEVEQGNKLKLK